MSDRPGSPGSIDVGPGSLPIEELPDVSWQRIERKLFAQLATAAPPTPAPRRPATMRRTWVYAGGTVAAAAVAAGIVALTVGRGEDAERTEPARSPSRIATADAPSALSVGDVSLEIAPHSALLVDEDRDRGVLFVLERGETTFRVAPVGDRPPVVVQAGDVRIEVVGTAFAVSREGDSARVVVYEGVVSIVQRGTRQRVGAGSVWPPPASIDEPAPPAEPPPAPARERKPHTDRKAAGSPAPARRLTEKDRYLHAQSLEGSDPDGSRALYAELVRDGGEYAPLALYAHALLEDRLRDRPAARKLLQTYLTRYPDGFNAPDARKMLNETAPK